MKKTIILFLLTCITLTAGAQNLMSVKGVVKDASTGEALIGVNILVPETQAGTITGIDGDFSIEVPVNGSVRISYVGYKSQTLVLTDDAFLNIALEADAQIIEEVVVMGIQCRRNRMYWEQSARLKVRRSVKFRSHHATGFTRACCRSNVAAQTGAPGAPISVRIRGVNSISLSNDPLYC